MTWRRLVFRTVALLGIVAFFAAFLAIFYPDTIPYFALLFQIYHAILGTPLFVLPPPPQIQQDLWDYSVCASAGLDRLAWSSDLEAVAQRVGHIGRRPL